MTRTRSFFAMLLVLLAAAILTAPLAAAQDDPGTDSDTTTTTMFRRDGDSPIGDILPEPNSGQAPDSPNDPGGWQQYLVFALIAGGLGAIVLLVRRESKRAKRPQAD
ncbi:MAG: hypothetical protein JJE52_14700 [Acidimicrobiia bacterium]|nr:hypothetical protein [Acidimicrobiia bacterium]